MKIYNRNNQASYGVTIENDLAGGEFAKRGVQHPQQGRTGPLGKMLDQPERGWFLKETGPEGKTLLNIVDKYCK